MTWTAHVWKVYGVDEGFYEKAMDTLQNRLSNQVPFNIESIEHSTAVPFHVNSCDSTAETLDNFEQWLEDNNYVNQGSHHMLVIDCVDKVASRARGEMQHDPSNYDTGDKKYARSIVNAAVGLLGKNRFKNTVIHEFSHTCLYKWHCPYWDGSTPMWEHSCGGVVYKGWWKGYQITPMLIANEGKIPDDEQCVADHKGGDGFTTKITQCTKDALDQYHRTPEL